MIRWLSQRARALALVSCALVAWLGLITDGRAQQTGQQEYQTFCAACHTIGSGRLIGPDLAGVHERRSEQWLLEFVQSSQSMVERGDPDAVAILEEYSGLLMPDSPLSEPQIRDVLSYLRAASDEVPSAAAPSAGAEVASPQVTSVPAADQIEPLPLPPEAEILLGQDLFQGRVPFANGGPTCNACHEVVNDAVIGGGNLAVDLTTVFSRLGGRGVQAVLSTSPFPVMQAAYEGKALTENEATSLVSFLQFADQESALQTPRNYGFGLFISGLVGTVLLFGLSSAVWRRRKRGSVNEAIFDRQTRSTWED